MGSCTQKREQENERSSGVRERDRETEQSWSEDKREEGENEWVMNEQDCEKDPRV